MKKCLPFLLMCMTATAVVAGPDIIKFGSYTALTNDNIYYTNAPSADRFITAELSGINFDIASVSVFTPTVTVSVVTLGDTGGGPAKTLYSGTLSADTWVPIREIPFDYDGTKLTNSISCIPLCQDKIRLIYGEGNTSNVTLSAWIYLK